MSVQPTIAKCYVFTDRWLGCVKRETDKLIDQVMKRETDKETDQVMMRETNKETD